jgi:peptide/nickel transport system permease protein
LFQFLIKKSLNSFFVLLGVITLVFFLFFVLLPADPARLTMGQRSDAKTIENVRKELYLDKPILTQFGLYLNDLSPIGIHNKSDQDKYEFTSAISVSPEKTIAFKTPYLRRSYQSKIRVWDLLVDAFPGTLILAMLSILIATVVGISLGILAAVKHNTWMDTSAVFTSVLGISAPSFFAGILIAYIFGLYRFEYRFSSLGLRPYFRQTTSVKKFTSTCSYLEYSPYGNYHSNYANGSFGCFKSRLHSDSLCQRA